MAIVVIAVLIAASQRVNVWNSKPWNPSEDTHEKSAQVSVSPPDNTAVYRGGKPSLLTLTKFPGKNNNFNVMERIGRNYARFGMFLLQDNDGAKVSALEHGLQRDPLQICQEIVMQWLQGKGKQPVTYATLVYCLRDAELNTLANDIEDVLQ